MGVFYALASAFSRQRTGIIQCSIVRTFSSTVLFTQPSLRRSLVLWFSIVIRFANNHPYIDNTACVLSDSV